jgi:hypothetical protein
VDLPAHPEEREAFFKISPAGRIPAIDRDGTVTIGFGGT